MARLARLFAKKRRTEERVLAEGEKLLCMDSSAFSEIQGITRLPPGALGEDLHIQGVELTALEWEARIKVGSVEFMVLGPAEKNENADAHPALEKLLETRGGVMLEALRGGALLVGDPVTVS